MQRRKFITGAAAGAGVAATTVAAPAIAQSRKEMVIVSSWPRDFPGLGVSAQRLAARKQPLQGHSQGRRHFAEGRDLGLPVCW